MKSCYSFRNLRIMVYCNDLPGSWETKNALSLVVRRGKFLEE